MRNEDYTYAEIEDLRATVMIIVSCVQRELGGNIRISDNPKIENRDGITLRWEKYDVPTNTNLRFNHKISYIVLNSITEPSVYAKFIVDKYKKEINDKHNEHPSTR